ncbi:hypothetical protein, partial [Campylobacter cuniculorum]
MSDFVNFDFDAFEKTGRDKMDAVNYLKSLESNIDFDALENNVKAYNEKNKSQISAYDVLKAQGKRLSFQIKKQNPQTQPDPQEQEQKPQTQPDPQEQELNAALEWLTPEQRQKQLKLTKEQLKAQEQYKKEQESERQDAFNQQYVKDNSDFLGQVIQEADNITGNIASSIAEKLTNEESLKQELERGLNKKIQEGIAFEDLNDAEKLLLRDKARDDLSYFSSIKDGKVQGTTQEYFFDTFKDTLLNDKDALKRRDEDFAKKAYEKERQKFFIAQKDPQTLSEEDEKLIKEDVGAVNHFVNEVLGFFTDTTAKERDFKEFKLNTEAKSEITQQIQDSVSTLEQFHQSHHLLNLLKDNESPEAQAIKQDYINALDDIATMHGFSGAGLNQEGDVFFFKEDENGQERAYHVNTSFFDNFFNLLNDSKFEIAGSITGGLAGASKGKSPFGALVKGIIGAAIGSGIGAGADYKIAQMKLDREGNFNEFLSYATQAGMLDLAGGTAIAGLQKASAKMGLKELLKTPFKAADKVASNLPSLGIFYRTGKNFKQGQNLKTAEDLAFKNFSQSQKDDLEQLSREFGGALQSQTADNLERLKQAQAFLSEKYGTKSPFVKGTSALLDALNETSFKHRRAKIVDLIRADESGLNVGILTQVASQSPKAQTALKEILQSSSNEIKKQLSNLNIDSKDLKEIFKGFESESKEAYNEAIDKTLLNAFKDEKTTISPANFAKFAQEIQESGLILELKDKNFLQVLSKNLYNEDGVNLKQLINMRKSLNANFKEITDPNLKNHFQSAIENFIKDDIDKGIENIFKQNPKLTTQAMKLFQTANEDYSQLKAVLKNAKRLKIFDENTKKDKILHKLIDFAKGQGQKELNNLDVLTQGLRQSEIKDIEISVLNTLYKDNEKQFKNGLNVFDSQGFLNALENLNNYQFKSQEAKDFIKYTKDFNKLFYNDVKIASSIFEPKATSSSSTMATSIQGSAQV